MRFLLAQLIDMDEVTALSPKELWDMLAELDDEVVNSTADVVTVTK